MKLVLKEIHGRDSVGSNGLLTPSKGIMEVTFARMLWEQ